MRTKLSSTGEVILPRFIRRKLRLMPGDSGEVTSEGGRIVISRTSDCPHRAQIVSDTVTGLPVITTGSGSTYFKSQQVAEMLTDLP